MFSIFVDIDCNKCGQTSCPVIGAEIQSSCNFEAYMIGATFWVVSGVAALCYILDPRITFWYGCIVVPSCLVISVASTRTQRFSVRLVIITLKYKITLNNNRANQMD